VPEREVSSLHPSFPPPQAAKHGVCNSPDSLSRNAIRITGIHNHGYILPEREKKDKGAESRGKRKERKVARRIRTTKSRGIRLKYYQEQSQPEKRHSLWREDLIIKNRASILPGEP
jgi:hypothetical protein